MNNYILLDNKKYKTSARTWQPIRNKPVTSRINLDGSTDLTYSPGTIKGWQGDIIVPVVADGAGWGDEADFNATADKREPVAFEDHYGDACNVHVLGSFAKISLSPKWDSPTNEFSIDVSLLRVQ